MEWINSHGPTIGFIFGVLVLTACLIKAILWLKGGGTYRETPKKYYRAAAESSRGNIRQPNGAINRSEIPAPLDEDIFSPSEQRDLMGV